MGAPEGAEPRELDFPDDTSPTGQRNNTYTGSGGVGVGDIFHKLLFAARERSPMQRDSFFVLPADFDRSITVTLTVESEHGAGARREFTLFVPRITTSAAGDVAAPAGFRDGAFTGRVVHPACFREGKLVAEFYRAKGFEVVSTICKVGRVPKEKIGVADEQKIAIGRHESMCNPICQAMTMNAARTHFNVLLGLCVGHDSLVFKYSAAPCTVLAAKDRVFGHNPLAAVYTLDSYYRYLKQPLED